MNVCINCGRQSECLVAGVLHQWTDHLHRDVNVSEEFIDSEGHQCRICLLVQTVSYGLKIPQQPQKG